MSKTVHIFKGEKGIDYEEGDPSLCGFTDLDGAESNSAGEWLHNYYLGGNNCLTSGETWCPKCEDAIDPLDQLAHTEL